VLPFDEIFAPPGGKPMTTLGEVLDDLEDQTFIGRAAELTAMRDWLTTSTRVPQVLNISGPDGIGKSTLLRAFRRSAVRSGYPVVLLDARSLGAEPAGLLHALGASDLDGVVRHLNELRPLVLLDSFDSIDALVCYCLEVLLPRLDTGVKVVVAGRHPLVRAAQSAPWARLIRPLRLDSLSLVDSRAYLARRGVTDPALVQQIWGATLGYPLGLCLAADAVLQLGVQDFTITSERHLVVRSLVETLLSEVPDPGLRELLEVCAVVREVDETTLARLSGRDDVGSAFEQLCRLSIVRPTRRGLTLPEQVRVMFADDLRWRRPDRHRELCRRAAGFSREQIGLVAPRYRETLMAERLRLLDEAASNAPTVGEDGHRDWVEPGRPTDHHEFRSLPRGWLPTPRAGVLDPGIDGPGAGDRLAYWLCLPQRRLRVVRNTAGRMIAGTLAVPLCQPTLPLALADPQLGPTLQRYWSNRQLAALPDDAEDATDFYLVDLRDEPAAGGRADAGRALWRDLLTLFARGGTFFTTAGTTGEVPDERLREVGFREIDPGGGARRAMSRSFVLDVPQIGLSAWLDLVAGPRETPVPVTPAEVEAELRTLLLHWADDAVLARSSLVALAGCPPDASEARAAAAVRRLTEQALSRARGARPENALAYQALELAFVARIGSHERVAERLAVSRSTLYRLLRRAEEGLGAAILQERPAGVEPR
jgi:hypothetical protein